MDDALAMQKLETTKKLARETLDDAWSKALECAAAEAIVQIAAQQLKDEAQVVAEGQVFRHANNVVRIVGILKIEFVSWMPNAQDQAYNLHYVVQHT